MLQNNLKLNYIFTQNHIEVKSLASIEIAGELKYKNQNERIYSNFYTW